MKATKAVTKDLTEKKLARLKATELSFGMGGNADKDTARGGGGVAGGEASSSSSGGNVPNERLHLRDQYHAAFAKMRAADKRKDFTVVTEQRKIMKRLEREIKLKDGEPPSDNDEDGDVFEVVSSDNDEEGDGGGAGGGNDGASEDDRGYGGGGGGGSASAHSEGGSARKKARRQRDSDDGELQEMSREMAAESARARVASEAFEKRVLDSHATQAAGQSAIMAMLAQLAARRV
jgi:hypothetical protein